MSNKILLTNVSKALIKYSTILGSVYRSEINLIVIKCEIN
jgi:hypothetical protein